MKNFKKNKKDFWNKSAEILEKYDNGFISIKAIKCIEKSLEFLFKPFDNFLDKFEEKYIDPNENNKVLYFLFTIVKSIILIGVMFGFYKLILFQLIFSKSESQFLVICRNIFQYVFDIIILIFFLDLVKKFIIVILKMVVGIVIVIREHKKEKTIKMNK